MDFSKTRALESAQKHLAQGRLQPAIELYKQILHYEPEDQVALMTIGDLFVRAGDIRQALEHFEKLAQIFANSGFTSKAIAIYKKIAKLVPDAVGPLERLAALYLQRGVTSEARSIYLQLAEAHIKANRSEQAVEVLRKILEFSPHPDNIRLKTRLAELLEANGNEKEAARMYLEAMKSASNSGDTNEAIRLGHLASRADPVFVQSVASRELGSNGVLEPSQGPSVTTGEIEAAAANAKRSDAGREAHEYVHQVLADADLFNSYGLHQKSAELLELALEKAPNNAELIKKLNETRFMVLKTTRLDVHEMNVRSNKSEQDNSQLPQNKKEAAAKPRSGQKRRRLLVFMCHARDDKPRVRELCERLRSDGVAPWLDEEQLLPGQDWQLEITKAVRNSHVVIVCLSRTASNRAGYVQKEIKFALDIAEEQPEGAIFLIPVRLEECDAPERLRRWQWVNLFESNGYSLLMRALRKRALALGLRLKRYRG